MAQEMIATSKSASMAKEDKAPAKEKKITKADWQKVESHLKEELEQRKRSEFREAHERKWKEVDRQVAMNPMVKLNRDGSEVDQGWHNVVELGELSKSSENISADVRRIIFPQTRFWFEAHADIEEHLQFDPQGRRQKNAKLQEGVNGRLRSLMMQQHIDFGLKDSVELSIKEALHHGSFVAEVREEDQQMVYEAVKVSNRTCGKWIAHSMWNCYPDPSPSVSGTNMFYEGTMFIESYLPRHIAERQVKEGGDGWMPSQWKKVPKDEHNLKPNRKTKDVKLATYWGDVNIERPDGDLYYPNHKVVLMNGTIVYMAPNKTPYPPIIYRGYERMDVRDPYYMSPIIKQSPMQKLATMLANKTMDGIELHLEPPIVYDGNDPDFVLNGGPIIAPGAKVSSKGSVAFKQIEIGDVAPALKGLEMCLAEMKEKLGRPGRPVGDRATKAEVVKAAQDQEVSLVDFIDKMELGLRSYLYMQHVINLEAMDQYSFYSPEMSDPDFITVKKSDLPKAVHFEVVGARGVLGEQERSEKMSVATAFMAGNPLFAPKLDIEAIALQIYQDAGVKNAERFLVQGNQPNPQMLQEQLKQAMQQLQQLGQELQQEKQKSQVKMAKIETDHKDKIAKIQSDEQRQREQINADQQLQTQKLLAEFRGQVREIRAGILQTSMQTLAKQQGEEDKAASEEQNKALNSVLDRVEALAKEVEKKSKEIDSTVKELKSDASKPKKRNVKAKKVGDSWQVSIEE